MNSKLLLDDLSRSQAIEFLVENGFDKESVQNKSDNALLFIFDAAMRNKIEVNRK